MSIDMTPGDVRVPSRTAQYTADELAAAIGRSYKSGYRQAEIQATYRHDGIVRDVRAALDEAHAAPWWQPRRWWRAQREVSRTFAVSEGASKVRHAMGDARPADDA